MGVGSGIFLLAAGAVLTWAVDFDLPYVADDVLGIIFMIAGLVAVGATVAMTLQRGQGHRPVPHRY